MIAKGVLMLKHLLLAVVFVFANTHAHEIKAFRPGKTSLKASKKKPWTVFIFMAARNDLHPFSKMNLKQMCEVGSTENLNIVVQLDEPGKKGTQRLYIERNNPLVVYQDAQKLNSGDPQSVIDFVSWGVPLFPADNYAIVFWDHATGGSIDPHMPRFFDPTELFIPGLAPSMYDVERSRGLSIPLFQNNQEPITHKGICFDDTYRSYINNEGLVRVFETIEERNILGKKWAVVAFDACLCADAAMIEIVRHHAQYMTASSDVEPGTGYNYRLVFMPFLENNLDPSAFATHIVNSYGYAYHFLTDEYTQSAIDLSKASEVVDSLHQISQILQECLLLQKGKSIKDAFGISCHRKVCISFDDPNFKDLAHLYCNILQNLRLFQFEDEARGEQLKELLTQKLTDGMQAISNAVIANAVGKGFAQAKGISIYCPEARMHSSFSKTSFAAGNDKKGRPGNAWFNFMKCYLQP
jgi:hypothetical protein